MNTLAACFLNGQVWELKNLVQRGGLWHIV